MNYLFDSNSTKPAYLQLYEFIRADILSGLYPHGTKLPSKRLYAEELPVSVITVQHALTLLADEGYIASRERSGYYVIYQSADFLTPTPNLATAPIPAPIPSPTLHSTPTLPAASSDLSFDLLAKTMRRTLLDHGAQILVHSPNSGIPELREEIAAYLFRNRGIQVRAAQIIIGSGAEYLYSLIAQLFDDQISIAVEDPCYKKIPQVYQAMGHTVEHLQLGKNGIRTEQLNHTNAGLLHVTPFHSYPSQITADISKKNEYLRWAGTKRYIIEDNYDSEITVSRKMEDSLFSLGGGRQVIYLNTFSHTLSSSLRMGYMVLPESLLELFEQKLGFYSCTVPVFEQYVLYELLHSGDFERHINRIRRQRRKASESEYNPSLVSDTKEDTKEDTRETH